MGIRINHGCRVRQSLRLAIYLRDNFTCQYCMADLRGRDDITLDHVVPQIRGGNNQATNLVVACMECNARKRHAVIGKYPTEIRKRVHRQRKRKIEPYRRTARKMLFARKQVE